jgi:hypothetical protein
MMKPDLTFLVPASHLNHFHFLLQQGIRLRTTVGENVRDFLLHRLKLPPRDVEEKVQTVFLNGKAVDDLDQAFITDGATLALSGALPGLVGATMRRGGFYSSLRNPIKYRDEKGKESLREGTVDLKLFNILLKDLAPQVLSQGFLIAHSKLRDFLKRNETELGADCVILRRDGSERTCRDGLVDLANDPGQFLFSKVITRG